MSNSLTINTPNIVQQNTPLRNVPSGSTAEPDYNVKYVPQSLTEEQQAQARLNIGAAAEGQGGGNATDLDKYWIVYPEGDTTISLHAGTINKLWMDGEEVEAVSDVYSVNAFSVVRIEASANASFIFSNTTDPIWLWSPAGINVNEPVYGTHYNVNLVNRNGGGSNLNFSGKVWLMDNKITPSMFDMTTETRVTKSPRIYLNDTPVDLSALTEEPDLDNCPTLFYIPQKRFEEFKAAIYTKFGNTFFNNMKCHWVVYEQLVQEDFKFRFILYSDPSEAYCYLKIYQDSSNAFQYSNRWSQRHCVGIYRNGLFEDPEHLMSVRNTEGENRTAVVNNVVNLTFGETLVIFNRYDSSDVIVVNDTEWNDKNVLTWMYVKNFKGNPLVEAWSPTKLNVVYENGATRLQAFGHNGGGTSYIYLNNNTISDGRFYLVINNNTIVFTNQSMSGVSKGSENSHPINQASDVKATIYCPRSRYDELVARYETLYATEIAGGTFDITWITDHIIKYDYIEDVDYRKNIVIMEQAQSDWNQSDTTAPDYIKNKPNISGPDFSVVEDMPGSLIFYTSAHGQPVQFNNGSYQQLLADTVISNGVYHYYPNKTRDFGIAGKTVIHIPIDPTDRTHTGYFRFYPNGTFDYLWLHTSYDWYGNSNNVILAEPFYQDLMCKDANIVINSYGSQQWNMYKINHTTSQNIQKFTVWTVTNTLWKEIWTGTGDVVMFDTDTYSKNDAEAPASLIGFTLYLPKNRYSSIVAQLKSDFGDSAVENYILPKVVQYDFICSEDYKYRMITLPTA